MTTSYSLRSLLTPLDQPLYRDLHIIDGTALVVRAFFKDRYNYYFTPSGIEVGAILYFFELLNTVISNACIPNVVIVFDDRGGSNYRRELYPDYKRNRPPIDNFLLEQMIMIRQLTESLGYSVISSNEFEADDVIASLCHSNLAQYYYIESRDKDFAQLLKYNNILLLDSFKRKYYDCYTGFDKFGVDCKYAIDFQALCGDSIDNIPGVKGIASTTAQALINQFGSLEQIYAVAEAGKMTKISRFSPQNITKKLLENKENAFLSYNLASLVTDVDLALDSLQTCHQLDLDLDQFFKYTQAYELYSLRTSLKNKTLGYPYVGIDYNYAFGSYLANVQRNSSNFNSNSNSHFSSNVNANFSSNSSSNCKSNFDSNLVSSTNLNSSVNLNSNFSSNQQVNNVDHVNSVNSDSMHVEAELSQDLQNLQSSQSTQTSDINSIDHTTQVSSQEDSQLNSQVNIKSNIENNSQANVQTTIQTNTSEKTTEQFSHNQISLTQDSFAQTSDSQLEQTVNSFSNQNTTYHNLEANNYNNHNQSQSYINYDYNYLEDPNNLDYSQYQSYMSDETMLLDNDSYIPNYEPEQHITNHLDIYHNNERPDLFSPDQWIKFKKKYPLLSKDSKVRSVSRDNVWKLEQIMQERKFTGPIE